MRINFFKSLSINNIDDMHMKTVRIKGYLLELNFGKHAQTQMSDIST
jgi:hypothetical protein